MLGDCECAGCRCRQGDETGSLPCFASAVLDVDVPGPGDRRRATETAERCVFCVAWRAPRRNFVSDRVFDVVAKFGDQAFARRARPAKLSSESAKVLILFHQAHLH